MKFPDLAPKEFIGIELLVVNELLPEIVQVRTKQQGVAKQIATSPQEIYPKWKIWGMLYLLVAGAIARIYLAISIVQFFSVIPS